jgi:hypothetical protein
LQARHKESAISSLTILGLFQRLLDRVHRRAEFAYPTQTLYMKQSA